MTLSFAVLLWGGGEIYRLAPPIPEKIVNQSGEVVFTKEDIKTGQQVWQSIGGQELGSIWGHGSYVAPDWSADWLHKEALFILEKLAQENFKQSFEDLSDEKQANLKFKLKKLLRKNNYDAESKILRISKVREEAIIDNSNFYSKLFLGDPEFEELRGHYAMKTETLKNPELMDKLNAFFFWASWSCITARPGGEATYTNNWPADRLVGNDAEASLHLWTGFSVIILLIGIGLLGFYYATNKGHEVAAPDKDRLADIKLTPSMKATFKYFFVVSTLFLLQIGLGVLTAHYGVEGGGFYGFPLAEYLPYSVTRTWHTQLGIFWIATSWLSTGLFIAPALSGKEPKYQKLGVDILFFALVIVVFGSMIGEWLSVMQKLGLETSYLFGHQGYEYVDLGRVWQILLLSGLVIWLVLMLRALIPLFKSDKDNRQLLVMFIIASVAIALFYSAGLMWNHDTHLSMAEYWRWWVVHLWVEGFFEVFATVILAYLFVKMGLLSTRLATVSVIFSTNVFLFGGIIGTFHHLYFTGTPIAVLALGASFSGLEVVPLVLIGFEAYHNYTLSKSAKWLEKYKWPIYFFLSVAFWNFVGAGIFGFLINPPIALYYLQGLNTTPVHGHTALFGVYGMLGIGLMLFCLKIMFNKASQWNDKNIAYGYWLLNSGLALMVLISLLPMGVIQSYYSMTEGLWYARSADLLQQDYMVILKWLRVPGDILFGLGGALIVFEIGRKALDFLKIEKN